MILWLKQFLHHFAAKTTLVVVIDLTRGEKKCQNETEHLDKGVPLCLSMFAQNAKGFWSAGQNDRQLEMQFGFLFVFSIPCGKYQSS